MVAAQKQTFEQWIIIKRLDINPRIYGQLIFDNDARKIQWEKDSLFDKWGKLDIHMHKKEISPYLTLYTENQLKMD